MSSVFKPGCDPKVKKTLVRNGEKSLKPTAKKQAFFDVGSTSGARASKSSSCIKQRYELDKPTLCSSETLAQYLSDARISTPPPLTIEELNLDKSRINAKVTRKLNFHFNDKIYKNLIELNANIDDMKRKKEKRPTSCGSAKRDLEPNIEDFYQAVTDKDSPPHIPVTKCKLKPVKSMENGQLHKLVAAFECL